MIVLNPASAILSLFLAAINIIELSLIVRMVVLKKELPWLKSFATASKELTEQITTLTNKLVKLFSKRSLSVRGSIIIAVVMLELIKLLIAVTF